jgi:hypothetical protein
LLYALYRRSGDEVRTFEIGLAAGKQAKTKKKPPNEAAYKVNHLEHNNKEPGAQ